MSLTPEQHREVARLTAAEREKAALAQAMPTPAETKRQVELVQTMMRRRNLKQRGISH